jgi:non-ribosomal peptide synthetase component F
MSNYFSDFSENAKTYADRTAIVSGGEEITYGELVSAAETFAKELKAKNRTGIVPVTKAAGIAWFVEVFGILAAGLAAVPISAAIPPERAEFILKDTENTQNLPDDAALIYYTSGSTGVPKGVILTNTGLAAFVKMHGGFFSGCDTERAAVVADPSFDAFFLSSFPQLLCGLTLYIAPDEVRASLVSLHKFLMKNRIETVFLTTQLAQAYMRAFDNKYLKNLFTGGEALRAYVPRSYEVYNLYGPCEATVYATLHKLDENDARNPADIPIGRAAGENRIILIDGIIHISGPQLAAGYLNRPDEMASRFLRNPFYKPDEDDLSYRVMYNTGDRADYDENGELHYRGRDDSQIKISGYRIEPEEIEAKIAAVDGITAVKVTSVTNENGENVLRAVCVGNSDEHKLRRELEKTLPRPMIPSKIEFTTEMKTDPRTGKGVIDRV